MVDKEVVPADSNTQTSSIFIPEEQKAVSQLDDKYSNTLKIMPQNEEEKKPALKDEMSSWSRRKLLRDTGEHAYEELSETN